MKNCCLGVSEEPTLETKQKVDVLPIFLYLECGNCFFTVSKEPSLETKTEARSITSISTLRIWKKCFLTFFEEPTQDTKAEAEGINNILLSHNTLRTHIRDKNRR